MRVTMALLWIIMLPSAVLAQDVGDFTERLNLLGYADPGEDRVLESLAQPVGPGFELVEADEVANPEGFGDSLEVDLDPTALTLTLTATADNCYGYIRLSIDNLSVANLPNGVGSLQLMSSAAFTPATLADPGFSRTLSTTSNSISVDYLLDDQAENCGLQMIDGASDVYTIVPEPQLAVASMAALATLVALRRRRP